ncbi:MAG: hypothetical protein KAS49_04400 [Candidatus Cloacimonetes bacterium]|nr:hypothetical protein [Candidatus Cloacimonadota bacterium]
MSFLLKKFNQSLIALTVISVFACNLFSISVNPGNSNYVALAMVSSEEIADSDYVVLEQCNDYEIIEIDGKKYYVEKAKY